MKKGDVKYVFVYGSLREGFFNSEKALVGEVNKRIKAKIKGKLYHLVDKGYPAMVDGDDVIHGELLDIDDLEKVFPILDDIENYYGENDPKNEYEKVIMEVETIEGDKIPAYVYKYNDDNEENKKDKKEYILHGDWKKYMENR